MKESQYGPQWEQMVRDAGEEGISPGDMYEAVGSSRQAVYGWINKNSAHLRVVGQSPRGGKLYVWIDQRATGKRGNSKAGIEAGVEVGTVFKVTRLRFANGRIVATLTSDTAEVEAELS